MINVTISEEDYPSVKLLDMTNFTLKKIRILTEKLYFCSQRLTVITMKHLQRGDIMDHTSFH
jgi:hypothetical protein